jgi:hypothetical protein
MAVHPSRPPVPIQKHDAAFLDMRADHGLDRVDMGRDVKELKTVWSQGADAMLCWFVVKLVYVGAKRAARTPGKRKSEDGLPQARQSFLHSGDECRLADPVGTFKRKNDTPPTHSA